MKKIIANTVLLVLCFYSFSCTTSRHNQLRVKSATYCVPVMDYVYDKRYTPLADAQAFIEHDTSLTNRFSLHDLYLANAAGILSLLQKVIQLKESEKTDYKVDRMFIQQRIQYQLLRVSTEIGSLAAEIDCEGERAEQLAVYLDHRDQERVKRLTLISVFVGAATTVITTLIQADNVAKIVGISGGVVGAGFGGAAAFSSTKSVQFMHDRNLLTDVWNQSTKSAIYSPFIWYVLNEKSFSNTGQMAIRANIRARWQQYVLAGVPKKQQQIYFADGGNYTADDLHARANMLNQLQASVRSINQDLQSLIANLAAYTD